MNVGQLLTPNTSNSARGNVLGAVTEFMNQRRAQEVQDDTLARDQLTRGLINTELGIDENANFKDFLGFQESLSGQQLRGAQTGLAQANALLAGERTRGLAADADKAELLIGEVNRGRAFNDFIGGQFTDQVAGEQFSSGNDFQDTIAGQIPEEFRSQFGNRALQGFNALQASARGREQDTRGIESQTPALVNRAQALAGVQTQTAQNNIPIQKTLAEHQANLARGNTLAAQNNSFNNSNQLDINRGARTQEFDTNRVEGINEQFGTNIDPRLGSVLGMDAVTMEQAQRQQAIRETKAQYDLLFKKDKNGKIKGPHKNTEESRKRLEVQINNLVNGQVAPSGNTGADLSQLLGAKPQIHATR